MAISAVVATTLSVPLVTGAMDEPIFGEFRLVDAIVMFVGDRVAASF